MREVYADHAATTPIHPEVLEAMRPYLGAAFGNGSSVHRRGEVAREAIEHARVEVATLVDARPEEVVFTASGSEANNLALKGMAALARPERRALVVSAIEHPSVRETARHMESLGTPVMTVPVSGEGLVDPAAVRRAVGPGVALVSVMAVNNEIGTIQPVAEIAAIAHAAGARMHVDAVQAAGRLPIDAAAWDVDLLTLAAHKIGGPLGAAALVVRRRTRLEPLVHGGQQERGRRAGTENLPAIVGFGAAAARAARMLGNGEAAVPARLGDRLLEGIRARVPAALLNGHPTARWRGIVNVCFPGVDGEALLHELDRDGVTISTGSACSSGSTGPSHVLLAMGLTPEQAHASVRFSLGDGNTEADVDHILDVLPGALERLRALAAPHAESA